MNNWPNKPLTQVTYWAHLPVCDGEYAGELELVDG